MPSWPNDWQQKALNALGATVTTQALTAVKAWKASTPLPPVTNNPLGMPAGSSGAPAYLGTQYAIFPSMTAFYSALAAWGGSMAGVNVSVSLNDKKGYAAAWRAISQLPWPASSTETDYPAALLDLTTQAYRYSVGATDSAARATSGTVGRGAGADSSVVAQQQAIHAQVANAKTAMEASRIAIQKGKIYGGKLSDPVASAGPGAESGGNGIHQGMECDVQGDRWCCNRHYWNRVRYGGSAQ